MTVRELKELARANKMILHKYADGYALTHNGINKVGVIAQKLTLAQAQEILKGML